MALDSSQKFISAQYFKDKLSKFDKILHMHRYSNIGLVLLCINWCKLITELCSLNHVRNVYAPYFKNE